MQLLESLRIITSLGETNDGRLRPARTRGLIRERLEHRPASGVPGALRENMEDSGH